MVAVAGGYSGHLAGQDGERCCMVVVAEPEYLLSFYGEIPSKNADA